MSCRLDVALGIVAYRDPDTLDRLLGSAHGFDEILVANVTADPTVSAVVQGRGASEIRITSNVGYASAVNRLAEETSAARLYFVNDDVVLLGDAAGVARSVPGAVTVPQVLDGGRAVGTIKALPTPWRLLLEWVLLPDRGPSTRLVEKWRRPTEVERVRAATATAVLCDVALLRTHPLPEEYFLYWEEMEWFWTLHRAGVAVTFEPRLRVQRAGGADERGADKWYLMGRNVVLLGRRRYGRPGGLTYFAIALGWLTRLALTDLRAQDRAARWQARRAALRGAWRGLRSLP